MSTIVAFDLDTSTGWAVRTADGRSNRGTKSLTSLASARDLPPSNRTNLK